MAITTLRGLSTTGAILAVIMMAIGSLAQNAPTKAPAKAPTKTAAPAPEVPASAVPAAVMTALTTRYPKAIVTRREHATQNTTQYYEFGLKGAPVTEVQLTPDGKWISPKGGK